MQDIPEQYVRTRADRAAIDAGYTFDLSKGERVCRFIERYVTPTRGFGADRPVVLQDWQRHDLIIPLFSWLRPDGTRRFRTGCLFCGRQNGKSLVGSALALYMTVADCEPGAYCVICAVKGEQTEVVFREVLNSVQNSPALLKSLHVRPSTREIIYPARNARLKGLSNEGWGKLGDPPHFALMDEFAFWPRYDPWTAIKTGTGSRRQPLLFCVSTSGTDRTTPAYEMYQYGRAIMDGGCTDLAFFPAIYAADDADDIHDEATWHKANPSLGTYLNRDELKAESERAKTSKIEELHFRQFKLGQWTTSVNQFLNLDNFYRCRVDPFPDLTGKVAYVFLDTSTTYDLSSVVAVVPHGGRVYVDHHSWCSRAGADRQMNSASLTRYGVFEHEGTLTVHDGNCIDLDAVRNHVRGLCRKYRVRAIGIDPSHNASDTMLILTQEGLPVVRWGTGPRWWNTPMNRLADLVNDGKLAHRGDALICWEAQNLEGKQDEEGKLSPRKPSDDAKIDAMICLLGAVGLMLQGEAEDMAPKPSTKIEAW